MLDGADIGIRFYIFPDFSKLTNVQVWYDAASLYRFQCLNSLTNKKKQLFKIKYFLHCLCLTGAWLHLHLITNLQLTWWGNFSCLLTSWSLRKNTTLQQGRHIRLIEQLFDVRIRWFCDICLYRLYCQTIWAADWRCYSAR